MAALMSQGFITAMHRHQVHISLPTHPPRNCSLKLNSGMSLPEDGFDKLAISEDLLWMCVGHAAGQVIAMALDTCLGSHHSVVRETATEAMEPNHGSLSGKWPTPLSRSASSPSLRPLSGIWAVPILPTSEDRRKSIGTAPAGAHWFEQQEGSDGPSGKHGLSWKPTAVTTAINGFTLLNASTRKYLPRSSGSFGPQDVPVLSDEAVPYSPLRPVSHHGPVSTTPGGPILPGVFSTLPPTVCLLSPPVAGTLLRLALTPTCVLARVLPARASVPTTVMFHHPVLVRCPHFAWWD